MSLQPIVLLLDCFTVFYVCVYWLLYCVGHLPLCPPFCSYYIKMFLLIWLGKVVYSSLNLLSLCVLTGFWHIISEVVFTWHGGALHVSHHSCYCVSSLGHCYLVASSIVVFCFMPMYSSMHPQSAIYPVHCCSWSCRQKRNIFVSIYIFI